MKGDVVCELTNIKDQLNAKNVVTDYVVDCVAVNDSLLPVLLVGSDSGKLHLATPDKDYEEINCVKKLEAGHSDIVRCQFTNTVTGDMVTGGEDSMVCLWSAATTSPHSPKVSQYKHRKAKMKPTRKSTPY